MEVKYSVNGISFKDHNVLVSSSDGLFNGLKRKKLISYDWAEYNGDSPDLSDPKFEARKIVLKCFVIGNDWFEMKSNFDTIVGEFQKAHTQRLLIEPFGVKPLPYEVYMDSETALTKAFNGGEMVGVFTLELFEPNPVKKVLTTDLDIINLNFLSDSETDIFWGDGSKNIFKGDVNTVKNYNFPSYQGNGNTIAYTSENPEYLQIQGVAKRKKSYLFSVKIDSTADAKLYVIGRNKITEVYEVIAQGTQSSEPTDLLKVVSDVNLSRYGRIFFKVLVNDVEISVNLSNPRIEKVEILGQWRNMTGKTKQIVIAGNINEIEELTTNASELWTRL